MTTYRMNGGIPGDKATILLNAVTIGAHYGTQYQEIYLSRLARSRYEFYNQLCELSSHSNSGWGTPSSCTD